jgi:HPt (histidine-containing phosphotransfer) domain-containing protein
MPKLPTRFTEPAIDPQRVEALRELGGGEIDVLTDLIDTFTDNAAQILSEAHTALENGDTVVLARSAHTLMGSCSNFGAKPLQDISREFEAFAKGLEFQDLTKGRVQAAPMLDDIQAELERVASALSNYRKKS